MRAEVKKAFAIGTLCAVAYFAVYLCRDILSALSPQVTQAGVFTVDQLGTMSSIFFITYAVGQLINGIIGDKIKSKYMVCLGLVLASLAFWAIPPLAGSRLLPNILYGAVGFFLAMIYAPMTKMIAENLEPMLATRCNVAHSMGSYLGAPAAGLLAAALPWVPAFHVSSLVMLVMGVIFFVSVTYFEKKGMVKYGQFKPKKESGGNIKVLVKRQIIKWTVIAMLTGIVRTAVLFWLPQYISEHLNFPAEQASLIYTVATSVIVINSFLAVYIFEKLKQNLDLSIFLFFSVAAACFLGVFFISQPVINMALMVIAMIFSNCASSLMWSRYCPSLYDTGMVSSATGFLDFCSYMAASVSSKLFAGAVGSIGWSNLILVWTALMACGILLAIPRKKRSETRSVSTP